MSFGLCDCAEPRMVIYKLFHSRKLNAWTEKQKAAKSISLQKVAKIMFGGCHHLQSRKDRLPAP